jgi:plasmid maintenance system antidote protein VapI
MYNLPHPGLTLRDDVLQALSPAMALRIERWLGRSRSGAAELWLAQQTAYDLWQARPCSNPQAPAA